MNITDSTRRHFLTFLLKGSCVLGSLPLLGKAAPLSTKKTGIIYDQRYLNHNVFPNHIESPQRLKAIIGELKNSGMWQDLIPLNLGTDPSDVITTIHSKKHLTSVDLIPTTGQVAKLAVAGALGAADAVCSGKVMNAFCAIRPPGHHAHDSGGEEGFCYYNNVAITARYIQKVYKLERILIIDWDFHHGNATQDSFYTDPKVLFFSTHNLSAYPGTGDPNLIGEGKGKGYNINVALPPGAKDDDMLRAWESKLLPKAECFKPEVILISAGFDSRIDDSLGNFSLSDRCFKKITELAMTLANKYSKNRLISLLEGGYNVNGLAKAAAAHIRVLMDYSIPIHKKESTITTHSAISLSNSVVLFHTPLRVLRFLTIFSLSGEKVKHIDLSRVTKKYLDLKILGLRCGSYVGKIHYLNESPSVFAFSLL